MSTEETTPAAEQIKAAKPFLKRIRWRSVLSLISLALSILCLIVGSLFVWVRATAYNPDGYVQTALTIQGQVSAETVITEYVQNSIITPKRAQEAAAKVVEPLPLTQERKDFLAATLATALRAQVGTVVQNALNSGAAQDLLKKVATRGSQAVVDLIQGEPGVLRYQGDAIVFDTAPLIKEVRAKVDDALGPVAKYIPAPLASEGYPQYVVAQGSVVTTIQTATSIIDLGSWLLPTLFLVLLIIGILLARNRRSAAYRTMIAIAVGAIVVLIVLRIAKSAIASAISAPASQQVFDALANQLGTGLLDQTLWLTALAAIVAFILWAFGPDRLAKRMRGWFGRRWADLLAGHPSPANQVTQFSRQFARHLEVGGLIIAAIVMIAIPSVNLTTWVMALVALALWFLLIEYGRTAQWLVPMARRLSRKHQATA